MTLDEFIDILSEAFEADTEIRSINARFHLGIPPTDDSGKPIMPCITLDGLVCVDDKVGTWRANINLWNDDMSLEFVKLSQHFLTVIDSTNVLNTNGFIPRAEPQSNINRSLYPVTFYIKG